MKETKAEYKILAPKLPKNLEPIEIIGINDEDEFSQKLVSDCAIEEQSAEHVTFRQVNFYNVAFSQVNLGALEIIDTRFENCDLSNMNLSRASIHRTEFINCKLLGANFGEATLRDTVLEGCNANYSSFKFADCKQVRFKGCMLQYSDFIEASFIKTAFSSCKLEQAQLVGVQLKGMDLTENEIEGIGVRIEDLQGVMVTPFQAMSLSKLMGIIVKEA